MHIQTHVPACLKHAHTCTHTHVRTHIYKNSNIDVCAFAM